MSPIARFADLTAVGGPLFFAQVPMVSPGELGSWLLAAAAVMVIMNQAMAVAEKFRSSVKEKPEPSLTYMSKSICEAMHASYDARVQKVESDQRELSKMIRDEIHSLHGRIDELMQALSAGRIKV
jgi:hypothetical protein